MSDNSLKLDLFERTYKSANDALARGDIAAAKAQFARAAGLIEDVAATSAPPLDARRRERAKKLRYIAENLTANAVNRTGADEDEGEETTFLNIAPPGERITFDDVIGLDEAKQAINKLLVFPLKNPDAYKRYGLRAGGFILLEGPPGTGKTTFAKAAASSISVPFAEVNANALVDSYIGKTGKNIDKLFAEARALAKKSGSPVVLFIDEIDYLAQKRGGENKTAGEAVPALIKQTDGFSAGSDDIVLIAATNIKDSLDPAVLSRFRNVIHIDLPTRADRELMFKAKLAGIDETDRAEIDFATAAQLSEGFSGRAINQVALDVKNALAARDAGLGKCYADLGEYVLTLIEAQKKRL